MKYLLLGHAQHGKDTVAQLMNLHWGVTWQSSSVAALNIFMFDILKDLLGYETMAEAYEDRHAHRMLWKELITAYNYEDKARLCRDILEVNGNDMYIGMRCQEEYEASRHLFDKIFWVDASQRKPLDPSMSIEFDPGLMFVIPNNGDLSTLNSYIKGDIFGGLVGGRRA